MANPTIVGLRRSWVQGCIAGVPGASVGPVGGAASPAPPPPSDDFMLAVKPADTTRTNTTTLADDPDLIITGLSAGSFAYTLFLDCIAPSNTPDIKYRLNPSAGVLSGPRVGFEQFESGAASSVEIKTSGGASGTNNPPIIANLDTWVRQTGHFTLTLAATVALQWAQNTLDAVNGTTLQQGSWLRIEEDNT